MLLRNFCGFGEVLGIEHAGLGSGVVGAVGVDIPAAEDDVFQGGKLHEFADLRHARFGPPAEANRAHLRERTHRHGVTLPHELHARHHRGGHRPHAWREHSEFPFWRSNTNGPAHSVSP